MRKEEFFREAASDGVGPLAGVRVVELTTTWAGIGPPGKAAWILL